MTDSSQVLMRLHICFLPALELRLREGVDRDPKVCLHLMHNQSILWIHVFSLGPGYYRSTV